MAPVSVTIFFLSVAVSKCRAAHVKTRRRCQLCNINNAVNFKTPKTIASTLWHTTDNDR